MLMGYLKAGATAVEFIDVKDELEEYYRLIDTDVIDIVERKIGGTSFDIIVDDEGLFREERIVTGINMDFEEYLVGSLLICHVDDEGAEAPLNPEDIDTIKDSCVDLVNTETGEINCAILLGL